MAGTIHVISPVAGFGNRLDLELVSDLLEQNGFDVTRYPVIDRCKIGRCKKVAERVLSGKGRFDINLFLAPIFPEWLPLARKNILIPNAEGFVPHLRKWLPFIHRVLAKTRMTERIFNELGCRTEFIGFTSEDHFDEKTPRDRTRFFHTCSSQLKGTKTLFELWKKHPEWPELVAVINHHDALPASLESPNVRAIRRALSPDEIRQLQNGHVFHICCSEAEGFGHYIMEAMSCRAVCFTTNAPPMNELVEPSRGILVDRRDESAPLGLSRAYFVKPECLEAEIERARKLDEAAIERIGSSARAFFLENDRAFRRRFVELMRSLLQ